MNHQSSHPQPASPEESRRVAEAARETSWNKPGFLRELFLGRLRMDLLFPFPEPKGIDRPEFQAFYTQLEALLREVDADEIDRKGKIPRDVIRKLAALGAFGMKIERKYGGLGLTQSEYNQVMKLLGSRDGNITALLSAHQSIGVPQPLALFGSDAQKEKYLPRIAKGAVSAFALTEPEVGSDPAKLAATVSESEDGEAFILNGEKLWCTNGTIAELLVVMARHAEDRAISAFVVEADWPGVEIVHHSRFMGLKALENAKIRFSNVRIPKENLIWKRGQGLKLALITLNTGRLALPATTTGTAKACLQICRQWANQRVQWGQPIGRHEAVTHKIADMAAHTFAMEAISDLATAMAEKGMDIRLEAAIAKLYNTEALWLIVDDTMQIRGGRGYETADSLRGRGEPGIPVERMMRDARINQIFEGSSEIMRLFIAREAVDKHLQISGGLLDPHNSLKTRLGLLPKIAWFYLRWYPPLWLGWSHWPRYGQFRRLAPQVRYIDRATRKLARQIFRGMLRHGPGLEKRQAFLGRIVDIGAELFAMAATVSKARKVFKEGDRNAVNLAILFCQGARRRIEANFKALWTNDDRAAYKIGRQVLDRQFTWLEQGIVNLAEEVHLHETLTGEQYQQAIENIRHSDVSLYTD